jgi:hypothetical protein
MGLPPTPIVVRVRIAALNLRQKVLKPEKSRGEKGCSSWDYVRNCHCHVVHRKEQVMTYSQNDSLDSKLLHYSFLMELKNNVFLDSRYYHS